MGAENDTICAVATPAGRGGVSIVRVSGELSLALAQRIIGFTPTPRFAHYGPFHNRRGEVIDIGITLYFPGPASLTGEDVLELQAHGGPILVDTLLNELLQQGTRLARPGEFSERAFLNDKIDLAQAEAIADLIESSSAQAARSAMRSLQGEFSRLVNTLVDSITELRMYVEAAIDFPDEDVDFLESGDVLARLDAIGGELDDVLRQARQGSILKEGLTVVIAGEPNAGKSSLLNLLSGYETAIVTNVPGTTRDTLKEQIHIDGMPVHVIDTAGLRLSEDIVEKEGIRRAWQEIRDADRILLVEDASSGVHYRETEVWRQLMAEIPDLKHLTVIHNKIDLTGESPGTEDDEASGVTTIRLSAVHRQGIEGLREHLKECAGYNTAGEGGFIARRRHLDALRRARESLAAARHQITTVKAGELAAEDLRNAQNALAEITGEFTPDDLLGRIFSSFCIGK